MSSEMNVFRAMMADDPADKDKYLYREVIKSAVQNAMFCKCGQILDMRKAVLFEVDDSPVAVTCEKCCAASAAKYAGNPRIKITYARELYRAPKAS